jgi:ribosomal protein L39E
MYRRWHCFMYMNDQVVAELVPVMKEQWDEWKRLQGIALAAAGRATLAELRENPVEKERLAKALRPNAAAARATLAELRENPVEKERLAKALRPNAATARATARATLAELRENPVEKERLAKASTLKTKCCHSQSNPG